MEPEPHDPNPHAEPEAERVERVRPWPLRLLNLLIEPRAEWSVIETEIDSVKALMLRWVVPFAAVGPVAKLVGGQLFGYNKYGADMRPPISTALTEAVVSYVLTLGAIYILSRVISGLAVNFGGRDHRTQAMKVAAYGATPVFLAGVFQLVPWLEWAELAGGYSLYLFYTGIPTLMHVTRRKAFTYTVVTLLAAIGLAIVLTLTVMFSRESFTPEFPDAAYNYTPPE